MPRSFEKLALMTRRRSSLSSRSLSLRLLPLLLRLGAAPTVDAEALLKSLEVNSTPLSPKDKDVFGTDSEAEEDENEGPWCYTLPDEHKLPTPEDASPDFDPTDAAVVRCGDKHYVVPISWYEGADEADLDNEAALAKNFIGMVTNPVYPAEDGEELTGTYNPKA